MGWIQRLGTMRFKRGEIFRFKSKKKMGKIRATGVKPVWVIISLLGCLLISASRTAWGQVSSSADLVKLAHEKFGECTSEVKKEVFDCFFKNVQEGKKVDRTPDLRGVTESTDAPRLLDPVYASEWGDSRVIEADWINWVCRDSEASKKVTSRGIEIDEARIAGRVDLSWLKLEFPIIIFKCRFTDDIFLNRASLRSLQLQTTYLKSLHGDFLNVEGDVFFANQCFAEGVVWLREARIAGILNCEDSQFVNPGRTALYLMDAKTGSVYLRKYQEGFHAEGEVKLEEATIGGSLDCSGGQFINPAGAAIDAMRANIRGSVFLQNFESKGQITFQDAQIEKEFCLSEGVWGPDAVLDLTSAKAKTLLNKENGWPAQNNLRLHAFTFDELHKDASFEAGVQKHWIHLQPSDPFRAQPFEMMARVLRNMGLPDEAVKVMFDKNERSASYIIAEDIRLGHERQAFVDSLWYNWFGKLIGYGYYWWNAISASLLVIVVGAVLFKIGYLTTFIIPTDKDAFLDGRLKPDYPRFNAFVYSLETFVPLVKLELEEYWIPDANGGRVLIWFDNFPFLTVGGLFRLYLWVHISLGWILTSVWVAGLTGLLKG